MTDRSAESRPDLQGLPRNGSPVDDNLLRHYASVLRRRAKWLVLGLVVGIVAGIVSSRLIAPPKPVPVYYKATNTLVGGTTTAGNGTSASTSALQNALVYAQSSDLTQYMSQTMHLSTQTILDQLNTLPSPSTSYPSLDVTGLSSDAGQAIRLADTAAAKIVAQSNQSLPSDAMRIRTLQPAVATAINGQGYAYRIKMNRNARNSLTTSSSSSNSGPNFDETDLSAHVPMSGSTRIALGAAAGLVLGLISVFVLESWDDRIRGREDAEAATGLGVLAEVPRLGRRLSKDHTLAVLGESTGPVAERYRATRTAVHFALEEHGRLGKDSATPVILVTSPGPGEGKTTTAANLAAAFAESGLKTLVIDGDFRRPTIKRHLSPVPNLIDPDAPCSTCFDKLDFLAGPHDASNPSAAIARLRELIPSASAPYDVVVLDTPPILTTNDAADLLDTAESVVVVLRAGQTRRRSAERMVALLERLRADVLGVVLNDCDKREMETYYGYGYGYYFKSAGKDAEGKQRPREADGSHGGASVGAAGRVSTGADTEGDDVDAVDDESLTAARLDFEHVDDERSAEPVTQDSAPTS